MKLQKVYSTGKILNRLLYDQVKSFDAINPSFKLCDDEFKDNRDWWAIVVRKKLIAYCGCLYKDGICIFVRVWVHKDYRGKGLQRRMIKARVAAARKRKCKKAITYTKMWNYPSANNLIKEQFLIYRPEYAYGGDEMLYFYKKLK